MEPQSHLITPHTNRLRRIQEYRALTTMRGWSAAEQLDTYKKAEGLQVYPEWHSTLRKQARFKQLNTPFRDGHYCSTDYVGNLTVSRWLYSSLTFEEWVDVYLRTTLPVPRLIALVDLAVSDLGLEPTERNRNFILNALWIRLFVQTEEGVGREIKAQAQVSAARGAKCRRANAQEDKNFHLDLVCGAEAFQVKPDSFLIKNPTPGHRQDQLNNLHSQRDWENTTGGRVYYLLYTDIDRGVFNPIDLDTATAMCGLVGVAA